MIRGLIFDCDGTLADTMPLHWQAWETIARRHRLRFPKERFYALGGIPTRDILKMLSLEQAVPMDHLAVAREKEAEYLPLIQQVEPVHAVLAIARDHFGKVPMAIASGGTRHIIEKVLERLGVRHLFSAVVTSEAVERQKPAPDIFFGSGAGDWGRAAFLPGLRRQRTWAAGDSGGGDGSGRRAESEPFGEENRLYLDFRKAADRQVARRPPDVAIQ